MPKRKPRHVAVYGWFAEGIDTHALKEARALLDELAL
jgi:hypothetical protein